jgi:hypothetical protein
VVFWRHLDIQAQTKLGVQARSCQIRPAPVFFVSSGALLAGVVEQSLRDILPDRVAAIQSDCIGGLDFHGPLAAAAGDAQHVALNLGKTSLPHLGPGRIGARSLSTDSQYSAGSGASGAAEGLRLRAASAASFSICFGVGMRQLAGRSVIPN